LGASLAAMVRRKMMKCGQLQSFSLMGHTLLRVSHAHFLTPSNHFMRKTPSMSIAAGAKPKILQTKLLLGQFLPRHQEKSCL
jgi:hypothetical protein